MKLTLKVTNYLGIDEVFNCFVYQFVITESPESPTKGILLSKKHLNEGLRLTCEAEKSVERYKDLYNTLFYNVKIPTDKKGEFSIRDFNHFSSCPWADESA